MEISVEDLREDVTEAALKDSRFGAGTPGEITCCIFVADLILDEDGWSAIIQAMDGKFYEVDFTVGADGEVSALGEVQEVEREVDWEPVDESSYAVRMKAAKTPADRKRVALDFERAVRARNPRTARLMSDVLRLTSGK